MPANAFVVDRALGAVPVSRLLDVRMQLRAVGALDKLAAVAGDRPVLTGDQTLQPNTIFPSEKNPGVGYYLPAYRVSTDANAHPAVELRLKDGDGGEIGRLTITLTWTAPQATGVEARPMDAIVTPALRYRIPVQGASNASGWERTTPLQPFVAAGPGLVRSVTPFFDKGLFDSVYQAISRAEQGASLDLAIRARVGVKTWRQVIVGQPTVSDQTKVLIKRGALFTEMMRADTTAAPAAMTPGGVQRVRLMRAAMVAPAPAATPAAPAAPHAAPAGGPHVMMATPMIAMHPMMATPAAAAAVTPAHFAAISPAVMTAHPAIKTIGVSAATMTMQPAGAGKQAVLSSAALSRAYTPKLRDAVLASDLKIGNIQAVPVNVVLDPVRQPAVIDADLDNHQSMPFSFDPSQDANKGVFIENYNTGLHLLIPLNLVGADGSTHVVYRDSLMRNVLHMPPSGFRLERDDTAPFLPTLSFLTSDFSTTDGDDDDQADLLLRVLVAYRLQPWLKQDVVDLARAELAKEGLVAHFTTGTAQDAKLSLNLQLLGDAQQRAAAAIDPATGITDTLDLDYPTFVQVWRNALADNGIGGTVQYQLFDGSRASVPVQLSLRETSAEIFDVSFVGPVAEHPGRYRVSVRNRVESPARIVQLPPELVGGGVAHAVAAETLLNQVLQPQEARQIDYDVTGATEVITDFSPSAIGQPEPNLPALLRLLMVAKGYSSLGFSVPVAAAPRAFETPASGAEPLTGLIVEFDDGSRATLTPSSPQASVTVVGRMIDQILGTADDTQRYFYRVTNLHATGEGARTSWTEGHGTGTLPVGGAVVRLDF